MTQEANNLFDKEAFNDERLCCIDKYGGQVVNRNDLCDALEFQNFRSWPGCGNARANTDHPLVGLSNILSCHILVVPRGRRGIKWST